MGAGIRFGEHPEGRGGSSGRIIDKPIDRATVGGLLKAGKPVVMAIPSGYPMERFAVHVPATGQVYVELFGCPLDRMNFSTLLFATTEPGMLALVAIHIFCDAGDPIYGDEVRWDQSVFLHPPEERRSILDLRSHGVWFIKSLTGDARIAALSERRFPLQGLDGYAALADPGIVETVLQGLDAFDPAIQGVHAFTPDDDPEEATRLRKEVTAFPRAGL